MRKKCKTMWKKRGILLALCAWMLAACGEQKNLEEDAYRQYGINCFKSGKYTEAIDAFQTALDCAGGKVGEKELDICFYKAKAQYLSGDSEAAMTTYNSVITYNKDARAYYLRGELSFALGNREEALADYKTAIETGGKNYELYIGIYSTLNANGMTEDARKYLNQAMQIEGEKPADCLYKGRISYLLGDLDSAQTYLTKALEGGETLATYYLGQICDDKGDHEGSRRYLDQYLESGLAGSYELYELGNEEMAGGDYAQALVYFNAGLKLESVPNRQNLMKSAIAAYEYSGDFASAKNMVREYLKLYPSDEEVQKESTFLETR